LTDLFPLTIADGLTIWPTALLYLLWPTALLSGRWSYSSLLWPTAYLWLTTLLTLLWPTAYPGRLPYYLADCLILTLADGLILRPTVLFYFTLADGLVLPPIIIHTLLWPTALLSGRLPYSTLLWPTALFYLTLADGPILPYSGRRPYYPDDGLSLLCSGRRPYFTLLWQTALLSCLSALLYTFLADGLILAHGRILDGGLIPHYSGRRPTK
jgi:hypothetical protein